MSGQAEAEENELFFEEYWNSLKQHSERLFFKTLKREVSVKYLRRSLVSILRQDKVVNFQRKQLRSDINLTITKDFAQVDQNLSSIESDSNEFLQ